MTLCQAAGESSVAGFMTVTQQVDTLSKRVCRLWFDSSHMCSMCSIFVHYFGSFLLLFRLWFALCFMEVAFRFHDQY